MAGLLSRIGDYPTSRGHAVALLSFPPRREKQSGAAHEVIERTCGLLIGVKAAANPTPLEVVKTIKVKIINESHGYRRLGSAAI